VPNGSSQSAINWQGIDHLDSRLGSHHSTVSGRLCCTEFQKQLGKAVEAVGEDALRMVEPKGKTVNKIWHTHENCATALITVLTTSIDHGVDHIN